MRVINGQVILTPAEQVALSWHRDLVRHGRLNPLTAARAIQGSLVDEAVPHLDEDFIAYLASQRALANTGGRG